MTYYDGYGLTQKPRAQTYAVNGRENSAYLDLAIGAVSAQISHDSAVLLKEAVQGIVVDAVKILTDYFLLH